MKLAIRKHLKDFAALVGLVVVAALVGGYILSHQGFRLPNWVPVVGTETFELNAEFQTAQAVTPGQGQSVNIAGVKIGEITQVNLKNGRAVVTMALDPKKASRIRHNATLLLRPKTGLQDMVVQINPGSADSPRVKTGETLPIENSLPDVNPDEFLASLDTDTRQYLKVLLAGAGRGLKNQGETLSATLRRFEPTSRDLALISSELVHRQESLRRVIHNTQLLASALSQKDEQLSQFVVSSNAVFKLFANQDANLRATLALLPDALTQTNSALKEVDALATAAGPTLEALRPGARALASANASAQDLFLKTVTPIKSQIRPFVADTLPIVTKLTPVAKSLAQITPQTTTSAKVLNYTFNDLAYNPPGAEEGYLFYFAWGAHTAASLFSFQDAHGPERRGLIVATCDALNILPTIGAVNPNLNNVILNSNLAINSSQCPPSLTATASGGGK